MIYPRIEQVLIDFAKEIIMIEAEKKEMSAKDYQAHIKAQVIAHAQRISNE